MTWCRSSSEMPVGFRSDDRGTRSLEGSMLNINSPTDHLEMRHRYNQSESIRKGVNGLLKMSDERYNYSPFQLEKGIRVF